MKVKDRVVTSKGRFGIIDAISADNTKAMVIMGHKSYEILIKELSVLENIIPINVTYVDKFDVTQEEHTCIINLSKNDIIYSFNPTEQIKKFDSDYKYIKKWVPEVFTNSYPNQIVDHKEARERCLLTYKTALQ